MHIRASTQTHTQTHTRYQHFNKIINILKQQCVSVWFQHQSMKSTTSASSRFRASWCAHRASASCGVIFHFSWNIRFLHVGHFLPPRGSEYNTNSPKSIRLNLPCNFNIRNNRKLLTLNHLDLLHVQQTCKIVRKFNVNLILKGNFISFLCSIKWMEMDLGASFSRKILTSKRTLSVVKVIDNNCLGDNRKLKHRFQFPFSPEKYDPPELDQVWLRQLVISQITSYTLNVIWVNLLVQEFTWQHIDYSHLDVHCYFLNYLI